ncbi:MAG: hypothetical protein N2554_07030 [Fimbriimonadales bacterium]|nr:hypothetical protein [Fimbriimonadales bacterium]
MQESPPGQRIPESMALTGVRDSAEASREWFDGLMFWGVMYRRLSLPTLLRGSWGFALGAGAVSVLLLPFLAVVKGGAGLHALLGWVVLMHLLARGWVERRLPDPSFANDLRTGNFEQLRLTPHTAHTLLIQRGLPDWLFRAATMSLWMPLYALVGRTLGLSFLDGVALWTLFSFANYFVLGLVSIALLTSAWQGLLWVLAFGLLGYAFLLDGGRTRTAVANSGLFSATIALPILGRVLLPAHMIVVLPDLRGFALLWLLVEMLRFERMARWVNTPSGVWRWFHLLPCVGLMVAWGLASWQSGATRSLGGAEQTQFAALGLLLAAGYLNLFLLTARRQTEPILQPLRAHLLELGLLRLLSLLLAGGAVIAWSLPTGASAFWVALLWVSVVEWLGGALTRWGLQRAHSRAPAWAYSAILTGLLPALVFTIEPLHPALGALSPYYALLMASDAWRVAGVAAQPPLWLCFALPVLRYALVLSLLFLGTTVGRAAQPAPRTASALQWLALPLVYPLLDWLARHRASNPITRLTIAERQPPFALLLGLVAFGLGVMGDPSNALMFIGIIPLGIFLWLWGYHSTAKRVRRWLDSGELSSAFLAGLKPAQIFWGWVYGAWHQQLRVLLAAVVGLFLGLWLREMVAPVRFGGMVAPGWGLFVLGIQAGIYGFAIALWSCAWMIAAPSAVRDQLALPQRAAPLLSPRAAVLATFYSLLACCAPLAPFLLIGLPVYASQSTIALHKLARAPGELKR